MGPYQCVTSWRTELTPLTPEGLMGKYGVQSLLVGIKLLGKLCRYDREQSVDLKVSAAELACHLAAACFRCSFTHPQARADAGGVW